MPWEDVSLTPSWLPSIGCSRPWLPNDPSSLLRVPYTKASPEQFYQPDIFHTIKLGIARHFGASFIVVLCEWGYFSGISNSFPDLLSRCYEDFRVACSEMRLCPHVKHFTRDGLHFKKHASWPVAGWKGSDSLLVLRWFVKLLRDGLVQGNLGRQGSLLHHQFAASHLPVFKAVHDGSCAILTFFQCVHKGGVWLSVTDATRAKDAIDWYIYLANRFYHEGLMRFHLEPTIHTMKHFSVRIQEQLDTGCRRVLNPNIFNCEMSEDFVGAVSRTSRRVAARNCGLRTLQRFLIKTHMNWTS